MDELYTHDDMIAGHIKVLKKYSKNEYRFENGFFLKNGIPCAPALPSIDLLESWVRGYIEGMKEQYYKGIVGFFRTVRDINSISRFQYNPVTAFIMWIGKKSDPYGFETIVDDDMVWGFCPCCGTSTDKYNIYNFFGYRCYACTPKWWKWVRYPKRMYRIKRLRK